MGASAGAALPGLGCFAGLSLISSAGRIRGVADRSVGIGSGALSAGAAMLDDDAAAPDDEDEEAAVAVEMSPLDKSSLPPSSFLSCRGVKDIILG